MWLTQTEKLKRMQRNKLHRWGQVLLIAMKNDAVPQGCQQWGDSPPPRPEEANEASRFQKPQRESCKKNATWLEHFPLKEASCLQREHKRSKDSNLFCPPVLSQPSVVVLHWPNPTETDSRGTWWWNLMRTASGAHTKAESGREGGGSKRRYLAQRRYSQTAVRLWYEQGRHFSCIKTLSCLLQTNYTITAVILTNTWLVQPVSSSDSIRSC